MESKYDLLEVVTMGKDFVEGVGQGIGDNENFIRKEKDVLNLRKLRIIFLLCKISMLALRSPQGTLETRLAKF